MPAQDNDNDAEALNSLLANLSGEQLRYIIHSLVDVQPDLLETVQEEAAFLKTQPAPGEAVIPTAANAVDLAAIAREIHKDFRRITTGGYDYDDRYDYDYHNEDGIDAQRILQPHIATVERLLAAGDAAAAATVLAAVSEQWSREVANLEEWDYEGNEEVIADAGADLAALLAEALLSQDLSKAERKQWLARIREWNQDAVPTNVVKAALEEWWDHPPLVAALQGRPTAGGMGEEIPDWADQRTLARLHVLERQGRVQEYLNLAKAEGETRLYLHKLALSGQTERAVTEAEKMLATAEDALSLAKLLDEGGQLPAARAVAQHGLMLTSGYSSSNPYGGYTDHWRAALGRWMVQLAQRLHEPQLALQGALVAFACSYEVRDYQLVQQLAGEEWPALREDLLESAKQFPASQKLAIYLYERMAAEVVAIVDDKKNPGHWGGNQLLQVLELTGAEYPDWTVAQARRQAEEIMETGKAQYYADAVTWLRRARDVYVQHDRRQEWDGYLASVRSRYGRKYKLMGLLREFA